jgi:hypothetical protein
MSIVWCSECGGTNTRYVVECPQGVGVFPPDSDLYVCEDCESYLVVVNGEVVSPNAIP